MKNQIKREAMWPVMVRGLARLFPVCALITTISVAADCALAQGADKAKTVKPGEGNRKFVPVKVEEQPVSGTIVGRPFTLVRATCAKNTIILDGGDLVASDPGKGHAKIVIEFPTDQVFSGQSYQVPYNKVEALTAKGQTKAPKVTYTSLSKTNDANSTVATNGAKDDSCDYAMDLRFSAVNKKGELPGYIRLQIGSNPVSELKGAFNAVH